MNNQLNQILQNIAMAKKQGKNPQAIMNTWMQQNPQMQQTMTQFKNMSNGRNPREFVMQLAMQQGVDEMTIGLINEIINN